MRCNARSSVLVVAAGALLLASCSSGPDQESIATPVGGPPVASEAAAGVELVVHRSPDCSCCGGWQDHMTDRGYAVRQQPHDDMAAVKEDLGVPASEQSCHTTEVEGYVVEGHVPAGAIEDLLDTRPDIDGIALAGMPAGAPGMPGQATGPLVVTEIVDGAVVGEFGRY